MPHACVCLVPTSPSLVYMASGMSLRVSDNMMQRGGYLGMYDNSPRRSLNISNCIE